VGGLDSGTRGGDAGMKGIADLRVKIFADGAELSEMLALYRLPFTLTPDFLKKIDLMGKDLREFSLDRVKMFYNGAHRAGFTL
jgi:hypothetical protein